MRRHGPQMDENGARADNITIVGSELHSHNNSRIAEALFAVGQRPYNAIRSSLQASSAQSASIRLMVRPKKKPHTIWRRIGGAGWDAKKKAEHADAHVDKHRRK